MKRYMLRHKQTGDYYTPPTHSNNYPKVYSTVADARRGLASMGILSATGMPYEQIRKLSRFEQKRYAKKFCVWEIVEFLLVETRLVA